MSDVSTVHWCYIYSIIGQTDRGSSSKGGTQGIKIFSCMCGSICESGCMINGSGSFVNSCYINSGNLPVCLCSIKVDTGTVYSKGMFSAFGVMYVSYKFSPS